MLSGRGLCDELITRPEESHRERESVCDREASPMMRPVPLGVVVPLKTVQLQESYDTRYIYLSESHKRLKQYLHEVSPLSQA